MLSVFRPSNKVFPQESKRKPQPSSSAIEALINASKICNNYERINVNGVNCMDICMMPGRTDDNVNWKACQNKLNSELNLSGGKRKSKKYRNKKKKTKRKRSYSSKKT